MNGWVDADTGEFLEIPSDEDDVRFAVSRLAFAKQEAAAWDKEAGMWERGIIKRTPPETKKFVLDETVVAIRGGFDRWSLRDEWAKESPEMELTAEDWQSLAAAAKDFDVKALPPKLAEVVKPFRKSTRVKNWVELAAVKVPAPRRPQAPAESEEDDA